MSTEKCFSFIFLAFSHPSLQHYRQTRLRSLHYDVYRLTPDGRRYSVRRGRDRLLPVYGNSVPERCNYRNVQNYLFSAFIRSEPARNLTEVRGLIITGSPVCGFRAGRSVCSQGRKVPNPWNTTVSPSCRASVVLSMKELSTAFIAALVMPVSAAICPINLLLFRYYRFKSFLEQVFGILGRRRSSAVEAGYNFSA